jgi:hypothetical protein
MQPEERKRMVRWTEAELVLAFSGCSQPFCNKFDLIAERGAMMNGICIFDTHAAKQWSLLLWRRLSTQGCGIRPMLSLPQRNNTARRAPDLAHLDYLAPQNIKGHLIVEFVSWVEGVSRRKPYRVEVTALDSRHLHFHFLFLPVQPASLPISKSAGKVELPSGRRTGNKHATTSVSQSQKK